MSRLAGVFEAGTLVSVSPEVGELARPSCLLEGTIFNLDEIAPRPGEPGEDGPTARLLAAYECWGEGMLGRLRGSFALVVQDPTRHTALLACDQLGSRSLFVHRAGSRLVFATEVRDLLPLLPSMPAPDEAALTGWLAGFASLGEETLYKGVTRLGAGWLLRVSPGGSETSRYWGPVYAGQSNLSRVEAVAAAREGLAAAVRRQVPVDAASGVLLSGGLDSSSVAALAQERPGRLSPVRAYSALFPNHPSIDESALIGDVISDLEISHTSVSVRGGSMVGGSLEYLSEWGLPAASPNHFLWQPLLSQAAQDGVTLMLDGEGGDELWQLSPYLLADRLRSGRVPSALALAQAMAGDNHRGLASLKPYLQLYGVKPALPAACHSAARRLHSPARYAPAWFTERGAGLLFDRHDPWSWKRLDGPRWWGYMADLLTGMRARLGVGDYLRHRAAMAGLEGRHPLIDVDLVELALSLPPALAIGAEGDRALLREAMVGSIPDSIRLRPGKSYFTALFGDCLAGRDLALVRRLLSESPEVGRYVNIDQVRELLDEPSPSRRTSPSWFWPIWRLTTAECWLRAQGNADFATDLLEECGGREDDWALSLP